MIPCYRKDQLFLGKKKPLIEIIENNKGRACYVYDMQTMQNYYEKLKENLVGIKNLKIHYAMKANANKTLLKKLKSLDVGVDVVSWGEAQRALDCGFQPEDIIFSGVAKSKEEIQQAVNCGIKQINVESPQELERIGHLAKEKNKKINVAFRMNPEVNPITHPYITTGMSESKFGMEPGFLPELVELLKKYPKYIHLRGLSVHIGSQLLDLGALREGMEKLFPMVEKLYDYGFQIESLDVGGGVGIHYQSMDEQEDFKTIERYGQMITECLKDFKGEILMEPGRVLVARCGILLCQVEYIKKTRHKNFAILNTGMHHLMRPSLYQAEHRILPLEKNKNSSKEMIYDFVGPICESSDFLAREKPMQTLKQGDFLAICDTGAYGYSMANHYNGHPLPKEIVLD